STLISAASAGAAPVHMAATSTSAQSHPAPGLVARSISRALQQPVELARVLARDLVRDVGRQVAELLFDVLRRLGPHAVAVRVVRAPHERLDAHVLDQLGADAVELERPLALAAPVVARLHRESEVAETVLPLEVHPVERIGDPADPALAERDADEPPFLQVQYGPSGPSVTYGMRAFISAEAFDVNRSG